MSSLLAAYLKTLKPLEVEEPIDVWVHRPLAFLVARAAYPTPVSPNLITLCSIVFGLASGAAVWLPFEHNLPWAGALLFWSAVLDCADGQLARMRQSFSVIGRMLDGAADLVVSATAVVSGLWLLWSEFHERPLFGVLAVAFGLATILTSSFQTASYDHYKNLFMRFTQPKGGEGEDYESALERRAAFKADRLWLRGAWALYLFYVKSQADFIRGFDPASRVRYRDLPPYDARTAEIYRRHQGGLMRLWRSLFGHGLLIFGLSVSIALGVVEYYMVLRLVVLNGVMFGYLRGAQRRASAAAMAELGVLTRARDGGDVSLESAVVGK